jgi:hypothetical protein
MKIKLLFIALMVVLAATGCLKDTKQAVSHVNDVNVSLIGTWTQTSGIITYYDLTGKKLYSSGVPVYNLKFDGKSTMLQIDSGAHQIQGSYVINTMDNFDFIEVSGSQTGPHRYEIDALHNRDLTLSETLNYPGYTLTVGAKSITYYKTIQVNVFAKKDLPLN